MIKLLMFPQQLAGDVRAHTYRIAGHSLLADAALQELAAFKLQRPGSITGRSAARLCRGLGRSSLVYQGPGWIGNQWRNVECYSSLAGYRVVVCGAGVFLVTQDGHTICQSEAEPRSEPDVLVETILGPVLILALALHGTWCLHASAVTFGGRVVALVGESGNGKSTLAACLGAEGAPAGRRIADDVLPVMPGLDRLDALPHFPQLKLPPEDQPSSGQPERLPLAAVYVLGEPEASGEDVSIQPQSRRAATLAFVRHTVAARLFDGELLAKHLEFCVGASATIPVRRLAYSRRFALLPRVREVITDDLRML